MDHPAASKSSTFPCLHKCTPHMPVPCTASFCIIVLSTSWAVQALQSYLQDVNSKLSLKVISLEDIRAVMTILAEIREKEAVIDDIISPVEDMYHMLARYEVRAAGSLPRRNA